MGIFRLLFAGRRRDTRPSGPALRQSTRGSRREVLSHAVRETLRMHGIPQAWLGAETLPVSTPAEPGGLHLRLVLRHTHPRFLANVYALERAIHAQLLQLDMHYTRWVIGTSWRVEIPFGSDTTRLPGPEFWQAKAPASPPMTRTQGSARDRVAGMLKDRDSAFAHPTPEAPEFGPTQPMLSR